MGGRGIDTALTYGDDVQKKVRIYPRCSRVLACLLAFASVFLRVLIVYILIVVSRVCSHFHPLFSLGGADDGSIWLTCDLRS